MNKSLAKVARAQGTDFLKCVAAGSRDNLDPMTIDECTVADRAGRVRRAKNNSQTLERLMCQAEPPSFGPSDAATVIDNGVASEIALIHDTLGPDLDATVVRAGNDSRASRCQRGIIRAVEKCQRMKFNVFNKCIRKGLKAGTIVDPTTLRSVCLGDDPRGQIARLCDPLSGSIRRAVTRCFSTDPSPLFPVCNTSDSAELAACLGAFIECRGCRALSEADSFDPAVCDLRDNGIQDGSCGALPAALSPVVRCDSDGTCELPQF
jgi:hypothetical protein